MGRRLIVEDGLLRQMAGNVTYVRQFPFLEPLAQVLQTPTTKRCSKCQRNARVSREQTALRQMRLTLTRQPVELIARLKTALGVDDLLVPVLDAATGKVETKTL
jgi:hypothetical protein